MKSTLPFCTIDRWSQEAFSKGKLSSSVESAMQYGWGEIYEALCSLNRYFIQAKNINGHSFVSIGHAVKAAQSITMAKAPAACCEGEERKCKKRGCLLSPLRSTSPFAYDAEIPGSLVSEPKHRDSRSKSRLGIGLGTDFKLKGDSESVSEPNLWYSKSRYRNRNRATLQVAWKPPKSTSFW